ncbi:MAG: cytochrome P450 [Acidobacteria bacterium]|nr:cytochrome P450 [Acidobacteriota bacterium]
MSDNEAKTETGNQGLSDADPADVDGSPDALAMMGDPAMAACPQLMYKAMRDADPVTNVDLGEISMTMVWRHEDVIEVLRNPEVYSSREEAVEIGQKRPLIPLQIDPPDHAKFRKILDPLFSPKKVALLEDRTRALAADLIEKVVDDGTCNFDKAIAEPLPSTVFLELLGLPLERAAEFIALKDGIIRPQATADKTDTDVRDETGARIYEVLEAVVAERVENPQDDFLSGFLSSEVDGHRLTPDDVVDIGYLFFLAGLDTVTASLDCMISFLAQNPEQRQQLVDDPSRVNAVIEELLRFETPVTGVPRITSRDTELGGCPIKAGTTIMVMLGSANTDEEFWDGGDDVDFDREVNKHLAFGGGLHRCLGSHLARMELRVVLEEWHRRVPNYSIADGVELNYSAGLRQIDNLQLVW